MYGAMMGDYIGSSYEFWSTKDKDFKLFRNRDHFTDDSVMTLAVAEALLDMAAKTDDDILGKLTEEEIRMTFVKCMKKWGRRYPKAGYGHRFYLWLKLEDTEPYGSFGNGSAMRVSPVGWLFKDMETTRKMAALSAAVTHDHPEGIKGAEATAAAIYLARTGADKGEIKRYIEEEFGYDLERDLELIRESYEFDVTCQGSVPEAILCFLEGASYEEVIREAVSLGGDADTQAAIAGGIAEAFYGIPAFFIDKANEEMSDDMKEIVSAFYEKIGQPLL